MAVTRLSLETPNIWNVLGFLPYPPSFYNRFSVRQKKIFILYNPQVLFMWTKKNLTFVYATGVRHRIQTPLRFRSMYRLYIYWELRWWQLEWILHRVIIGIYYSDLGVMWRSDELYPFFHTFFLLLKKTVLGVDFGHKCDELVTNLWRKYSGLSHSKKS